jgi:hypothetical protein
MGLPDDGKFYQVGEVALPEGYEGRELHFFIGKGRVEVWILPRNPQPGDLEAWLSDRRQAGTCSA